MTNRERYAYVAGFLDADGTITVSYGRKTSTGYVFVPVICFYNSDRDNLLWIQKAIGGNLYDRPRVKREHTRAMQLNLRNRTEMAKFLPKVIPFLIRKKKQGQLLQMYLNSRTRRGWKNHAHLPANRVERRCLEKIRYLNKSQCAHAKELSSLPARYQV